MAAKSDKTLVKTKAKNITCNAHQLTLANQVMIEGKIMKVDLSNMSEYQKDMKFQLKKWSVDNPYLKDNKLLVYMNYGRNLGSRGKDDNCEAKMARCNHLDYQIYLQVNDNFELWVYQKLALEAFEKIVNYFAS